MSDDEEVTHQSGFNEITKDYKASPTIENYVLLRRKYPHVLLEIATSGGIEFLFSQEKELRLHGIDPDLVEGAMDAQLESQAELSLLLLELLIKRKLKERNGETHIVSRGNAISDQLVNYLIAACLDGLDWTNKFKISRELIVLIKHQLGPICTDYELEEKKKEQRTQAIRVAIQLAVEGITPSYRRIGRVMGVEASTVMRWFPDRKVISELKSVADSIKDSGASARSGPAVSTGDCEGSAG